MKPSFLKLVKTSSLGLLLCNIGCNDHESNLTTSSLSLTEKKKTDLINTDNSSAPRDANNTYDIGSINIELLELEARSKMLRNTKNKFEQERKKAATTIQKFWRGYKVRDNKYEIIKAFSLEKTEKINELKLKLIKLQRELKGKQREEAAIKIQKVIRGKFARDEFKVRREIAQRLARENVERLQIEEQIEIEREIAQRLARENVERLQIEEQIEIEREIAQRLARENVERLQIEEQIEIEREIRRNELRRHVLRFLTRFQESKEETTRVANEAILETNRANDAVINLSDTLIHETKAATNELELARVNYNGMIKLQEATIALGEKAKSATELAEKKVTWTRETKEEAKTAKEKALEWAREGGEELAGRCVNIIMTILESLEGEEKGVTQIYENQKKRWENVKTEIISLQEELEE